MKHPLALAAALVVLVAACGGSPKSTSTPTATAGSDAPAATASAAPGLLGIVELKFFDEDNKLGMHLHPDGKLETLVKHSGGGKPTSEDWKQLAVFSADGTISVNDQEVAQLQADGTLKSADGRVAPFKIDGATLVAGGKKLAFDDKGQLTLDGEPVKEIRVEGITELNTKRTALLIVAMSLPGQSHESGPASAQPAN
jgi:hypothetical protein